jgi:pimeloyl-ACP methyl ester carboxylesterase
MERALYMEAPPRLFGMLFLPEAERRQLTSFVVVHPFAEEKKSAHRTLVELSRRLYKNGFPVLMFDLRGCGDSEGDFASVRLHQWTEDVETAVTCLKSYAPLSGVNLIGLRFGAYLVACHALQYGDISGYILIEPILQPLDYLRKSLRQKLMKELCTNGCVTSSRDGLLNALWNDTGVDFDGYEIGSGLYRDLTKAQNKQDMAGLLKNINRGLLVSVSMNGKAGKSVRGIRVLKPEMAWITVQMELFWNKVDDADSEKLIDSISNHVINHYV